MKNKVKKSTKIKACVIEECPFNKLMKSNFMESIIDVTSKNLPMMKVAASRENDKETKIAFVDVMELIVNEYNKKYRNINLITEVQP